MFAVVGKLKTAPKYGKSIEKHQNTFNFLKNVVFLTVLAAYPSKLSRICTKKFMQVDLVGFFGSFFVRFAKSANFGG